MMGGRLPGEQLATAVLVTPPSTGCDGVGVDLAGDLADRGKGVEDGAVQTDVCVQEVESLRGLIRGGAQYVADGDHAGRRVLPFCLHVDRGLLVV